MIVPKFPPTGKKFRTIGGQPGMGTARTAAEYVAEGILGGPFSETYERDLLEAQVKAVC